MIFVIGLGNPDKRYQNTWHNLGFLVVDEFQKENNFPDFSFFNKFSAEISEGEINGEKVILAKPQTYMNNSGVVVKKLIKNLKLKINLSGSPLCVQKNLLVVHDDIDLPLGKIRISKDKSSAGHKGVESIIKEIGNKNFVRFRIGILPKEGKPRNPEKFVLQKFQKEKENILKEVIQKTTEAIDTTIKEGLEKAMNEYN